MNYLVGGGQQRFRDGEAERLGGLEVDYQLDFRDLLHGKIGWFLAFENPPGLYANLAVRVAVAGAIAHQATGQGGLTPLVDRGQRMAGG